MSTLTLSAVLQLAMACAPYAAPDTIAAIAKTESGFDTLAIYVDPAGPELHPASVETATALATRLIASGRTVDLGLMQISSPNLADLGLSVRQAFEPCRSVAAGGAILLAGFDSGGTAGARQRALRVALSRYNTGDPRRGFANGYVARVEHSATTLGLPVTAHAPTPTPAPEVFMPDLHPSKRHALVVTFATQETEDDWRR